MKTSLTEYQQAIEDFLTGGGAVTQLAIGESSPTVGQSMWGKPRPKDGAPKEPEESEEDEENE